MPTKLILSLAASGLTLALLSADEPALTVTTNGTEVTACVTSGQQTLTAVYGRETTKLIKTGVSVLLYQPSGDTPYGALEIQKGQVQVADGRHVGAGPISILSDGMLMIRNTATVLTNKVTFGVAGRLAAFNTNNKDDACVTLTSVGVDVPSGNVRRIVLGRIPQGSSVGVSHERLSLTGADSEALERIDVDGMATVEFDGGTVAAAATAKSPFIREINSRNKTYSIAPQGVTFDVAEGADVALGVTPAFQGAAKATNCVETASVPSGDFESGSTGWTIVQNDHKETSQVGSNSDGFCKGSVEHWPTPSGAKYFHLRRGASMSRSVEVPADGLWRLAYLCGSRPPNPASGYSLNMETTVKIDDETVLVVPALTAASELHPFERVETRAIPLAAGTHTVSLVHTDTSYSYGGQNYDAFVLERCEEVTVDGGLVKSGDGRLLVTDVVTPSPVTVRAGVLRLDGATLDGTGAVARVAAGARLELAGAVVTNGAAVSVEAGGRLVLSEAAEPTVLVGGSFESPKRTSFAGTNPTGWTRSLTDSTGKYQNANGAGIRPNTDTSMQAVEDAPDGTQVAYLRNYTKLTQVFTNTVEGAYRLTFRQSVRKGTDFRSHTLCVRVTIDGSEILTAGPFPDEPNYGYKPFAVKVPDLAAGEHTISFEAADPDNTRQGAIVYIDDVRLMPFVGVKDIADGELRLSSEATLDLDYAGTLRVARVLVDGREVNGSRRHLEKTGLTVTGTGRISAGAPLGLSVIVR